MSRKLPEPLRIILFLVVMSTLGILTGYGITECTDAQSRRRRAEAALERQHEAAEAEVVQLHAVRETAAISKRCPLERVLLVKHYKAHGSYCLNVCGTYMWFRRFNWAVDDRDCSWLAEKEKHP